MQNFYLHWQAFTAHFVSKVMPIHFIDGNNYNYVGLICNSVVCCNIWINSAHNAGMKNVIMQGALYFFYTLLALLILNTTAANHTQIYDFTVDKNDQAREPETYFIWLMSNVMSFCLQGIFIVN